MHVCFKKAESQNTVSAFIHHQQLVKRDIKRLCVCVCVFSDVPDVQSVLENLGADGSLLEESVLIGCSEQNQAQFCLDVGKKRKL